MVVKFIIRGIEPASGSAVYPLMNTIPGVRSSSLNISSLTILLNALSTSILLYNLVKHFKGVAVGNIYIDPIFQIQFEAYSLVLGGKLALFNTSFRAQFKPEHSFSIAGKISQDAWIVFQDLFNLLNNKKGTWQFVSAVAPCQFLSSTWDILISDSRYESISTEDVVQFFRHVRNAASHGNHFNIEDRLIDSSTNKLIRKAEWRGKEIEPSLHNTILIPDFMEMADPIWLVSDISGLLKTVF
jgi:hypothetical protein